MTLTQLEYFLALVEHRSFSRAAKECGVTQPTLSAQFQKLEEELGHPLLDRKSKPMALTPMGNALIEQAKYTVESASAIRTLVDQFEHPVVGELRLGILAPLGSIHGAFWQGVLSQACPQISLQMEEAPAHSLQKKLAQAELDAAIVQLEGWNAPGSVHPLFEESWWALAPQVGGKPPVLTHSEAWLMGPEEEATTRYAISQGWKASKNAQVHLTSLYGRANLAVRGDLWVLLAESELALLPPEAQKRAQLWGGPSRVLAWVQGIHTAPTEVHTRVLAALKDRLPSSLRPTQ